MYTYVCIYIYTHVYVYIYIYIHTHTYAHRYRGGELRRGLGAVGHGALRRLAAGLRGQGNPLRGNPL